MKATQFHITVHDFSALSFGDIQINNKPSAELSTPRPRLAPESAQDFNVHPDGLAAANSARQPGRETHRALKSTPVAPKPARVLIVDDEHNIRESLAKVLRSEGYDVRLAENGQQALAHYDPEYTDLVLMDMNMPVQNGWDTLTRLFLKNPHQAVIIITGKSPQLSWATRPVAGTLLEKPIDMTELLDCIKRMLSESQAERDHRIQIQQQLTRLTRPLSWFNSRQSYPRGGINE
ncbi:MAG TPA: response regulator [Verrucomicrobiota bacterium]|nr:response regulator [Verrucomicrobiota bacterium]